MFVLPVIDTKSILEDVSTIYLNIFNCIYTKKYIGLNIFARRPRYMVLCTIGAATILLRIETTDTF